MGTNTVVKEQRTDTIQYEKTTLDQEEVAGRFGTYGTTAYQGKIQTGNPDFIFEQQKQNADLYNGKTNSLVATDGKPADIIDKIGTIAKMILDDGQSLVKGDPIQGELTTGIVQKLTKDGIQAGRCYSETAAASGANGEVLIEFDPLDRTIVETLTPTSHIYTPTKTPVEVLHVEAIAGDGTLGELLKDYLATSPAAGHIYIDLSTPDFETNATDNFSSIKVKYKY